MQTLEKSEFESSPARNLSVGDDTLDHSGRSAVKKAARRLIPVIMLCYFIAFLDRTNIGIGALQLNKDLGMTAAQFGFGAGLFFLLYFTMEVPSNLLMTRYGVARWVTRIMFSWGVVAGAMALVQGPLSFYAMRALLGLAEAGFFPAMVFYLTQWFPASYRGRVISYLQVAGPLSYLIGGPVSTTLLGFDGVWGFKGWQWMFVLEALPAILIAGFIPFLLPERPANAKWLAPEEKSSLTNTLANEDAKRKSVREYSLLQAMFSSRILLLSFTHFSIALVLNGVAFFLPQIVKAFGVSNWQAGIISTIPSAAGVVGILFWGRRSDAKQERRYHTAVPLFLAVVGLLVAAFSKDPYVIMGAFCLVVFGGYGSIPVFWTLPSTFLSGAVMAAAIAVINSIGNLGGFAGPWIMGLAKDTTGSFTGALVVLAAIAMLGTVVCLCLPDLHEHALDRARAKRG